MNIKKIKLWQVLVVLVVLLSIPTAFVFSLERYTTSNEKFCMTCHYKMWGKDFLVHSNIHPDSVRCPQCHAKHGEIIPKEFSAHPERINPNCARCHKEMYKKTDTEGFKYNVMNIYIPHKFHLQEVGAVCTDCHNNIKHDKFRPVTNRPKMESCMACHDNKTQNCSKCHQRGASEVLAALPITQKIERKTCENCHEGFAERVISFYRTEFPHTKHLSQGLDCEECHSNASVHGQIVKPREDCMSCHHNQDRGCTECHTFENSFRKGTALTSTPGDPDVMADAVTCDVCHAGIEEGHSRDSVLAACSNCHDDPAYKNRVDEIQNKTDGEILILADLMKKGKRIAETLPESAQARVNVMLDQTEEILKTLKKDKSRGFHNAAYSAKLLKDGEETLQKVITWQQAKTE